MAVRTLKFSLSSFWRVSSGAGAEAQADSVVVRDAHGLPIIPGRAIKGLLRDAMNLATLSGAVSDHRLQRWFGSPLPGQSPGEKPPGDGDEQELRLEQGRFSTEEGALWFGSAKLPKKWTAWVPSQGEEAKRVVDSLFTLVSSTAIDGKGVAREHSLRVNEVAVPMDLRAEIHGPDDDLAWVEDIRTSLPLLRALGSRRNRGFGRVDVTLEEKQ